MQKRDHQKIKKVDKDQSDTLDRFLKILWKKQVEYKNI